MQIQLLERVVEDVIGKSATKIVDILAGKKDVNEFLIAKKLGLTINQTRNILYKFSDFGLISSIRKKDNKKGWYIYYWTLNIEKSLNFLEDKLKKELNELENKLKSRKNKNYYYCEICGLEVNEETALGHNFVCPECGEVYSSLDNTKIIQEIEKRILKLKEDLEIIKQEKEKVQEKQRKRAKRQEKKEKKKKAEKRKKRKTKKKSKKKTKKRKKKKKKKQKKKKRKRKKQKKKKKRKLKKVRRKKIKNRKRKQLRKNLKRKVIKRQKRKKLRRKKIKNRKRKLKKVRKNNERSKKIKKIYKKKYSFLDK